MHHAASFLLCLTLAAAAQDSDGDGLSDFHERHKYLTDPANRDSDGDGVPDGDWQERREFTYSVRSQLQVLEPYNIEALQDDYQDARVLADSGGILTVEIIHYPLNTNALAIVGDPDWREGNRDLAAWLEPGPTSNWDAALQASLMEELARSGIVLEGLDDKLVVERVSAWLIDWAAYQDGFTTFLTVFDADGRPSVPEDLRPRCAEELARCGRSLEEQWRRELFGKAMFATRSRGSCTSSAIFLQTCLRALGIPTRTVICVPAIDASDPQEHALLDGLQHHGVRMTLRHSVHQLGASWASHTFNEVWVGGRWRRLNYSRLGQNILDRDYLGLMTHVHTYRDHAEAGLVRWGRRDALREREDVFAGSNPYSCLLLEDAFGPHCGLDNPRPSLTLTSAYWVGSEQQSDAFEVTGIDAHSGHFLAHAEDVADAIGVYAELDKVFRLRAPDGEELDARAERGYWTDPARAGREFYFRIPPFEYARMRSGVPYTLVARNREELGGRWIVEEGVALVKD